jgi:6-phosphogluconolactonase
MSIVFARRRAQAARAQAEAAIAEARTTMLVISGEEKQQLLEKAVEDGAKSTYPVGRVIVAVTVPVDIYCLTV